MKQSTFLIILVFLFSCLLATGYKLYNNIYNNRLYNSDYASNLDVEVVLPEEYTEITTQDTLIGYYNKRQNILYIAFNNSRNKTITINSHSCNWEDCDHQGEVMKESSFTSHWGYQPSTDGYCVELTHFLHPNLTYEQCEDTILTNK